MPTQYKVKLGDHLTGIADGLGLPDTQTILSQSANDALGQRKHPEMLKPGETLTLPDLKLLKFTLATGQRHKLTIQRPKAKLCVSFVAPAHRGSLRPVSRRQRARLAFPA
jgi:hypothetical protein